MGVGVGLGVYGYGVRGVNLWVGEHLLAFGGTLCDKAGRGAAAHHDDAPVGVRGEQREEGLGHLVGVS